MSTSPRALTELIEAWRDTNPGSFTDWDSFVAMPFYDPARIRAAWLASDDPTAMLLLLALVHPSRNEEVCCQLTSAMASEPSFAKLAREQEEWQTGKRFNGQSPFYFLQLARRTVHYIRGESADKQRRLAEVLRGVVPDPYRLD